MPSPDLNDTLTTDIVVSLDRVSKVFHQRQRSERIQDILKNLFRTNTREIWALHDVDLTIHRGEIVAYAGPNGAGKSTTVKLLSGMLLPTRGTVHALGQDPVRDRVRYVGRIGVVYGQRTELWWDHPVAASFDWKRVVWDIPQDRYYRMRDLVIELLGLREFYNTLARELSLGQRMRADLGLMLLHEPEILFLDEPTLGLDVLAKRDILDFIKRVNREQHVTVMITSHDMSDLEQLAGRIVMIDQGKIAFDGDFTQLRRRLGATRRLLIETDSTTPPQLPGAELLRSEGCRHEYRFDETMARIPDLLKHAADVSNVLDVETHQAPIDDVVAGLYERWKGKRK